MLRQSGLGLRISAADPVKIAAAMAEVSPILLPPSSLSVVGKFPYLLHPLPPFGSESQVIDFLLAEHNLPVFPFRKNRESLHV